ncbi:phytoene desaturase family protein [Kutzneria kofuensis]|uniref:Pyridine nucleotide-disulfide oxidoreductase domain-containing protein 2 n=1 Tax=Kutzneria kofuensis TaxID=103725 RepID=A0A7W9KSF8_9PSEU|nr:NAD(P)/FAD-dependent oxidoreductase [Kutzneria kofuensis]MBB5897573.1 phytoene dehydrogenase-like protein [Kutzneria kofuensis]
MDFDAVIVGAGHNGLVAANLLADAGWRVLVLEATDEPGGSVRSAEVTAPGFVTDLYSSSYPLAAASPVFADLQLERHGLRWRHAEDVLAHVLPDGRGVVLARDIARTMASVAQFDVGDADAWRAMHDEWLKVRTPLVEALLRPFPPVAAAGKLLRAAGSADALRLARMLTLSSRVLVEERFAGEGAKLLVNGNAMHADAGIDSAGSGVFGWLLAMVGQDLGYPTPEGGAGQLTAALLRRLESVGGQVECGRRVTEVLIARGTAVGVRDHEGDAVRATKAVLADVPAPHLYRDLVAAQHLPSRLLKDLQKFHWDPATIKVNWALSGPIPWTAEEAAHAGVVHLGGDMDMMSGTSMDLAMGRTPRNPFLLLGQTTTADPTRSPAGTESVWAYTHVPQGQRWTKDRVTRFADKIQQVVEKHAPGFADRIIARHVQGPDDFTGTVSGGSAIIGQQLVFRPTPGLGRADTPVDRLFLAGSSAHPGGGVHGGPGGNAARAALARATWGGAYKSVIGAANRLVF